jgi:hypothetical protein
MRCRQPEARHLDEDSIDALLDHLVQERRLRALPQEG